MKKLFCLFVLLSVFAITQPGCGLLFFAFPEIEDTINGDEPMDEDAGDEDPDVEDPADDELPSDEPSDDEIVLD